MVAMRQLRALYVRRLDAYPAAPNLSTYSVKNPSLLHF